MGSFQSRWLESYAGFLILWWTQSFSALGMYDEFRLIVWSYQAQGSATTAFVRMFLCALCCDEHL